MPPTAKPLPAPLDGAPLTGPTLYTPPPGRQALWPNGLPPYVEVWGVLQGESAGEPLASVAAKVLGEVEDEVRVALAGASSRDAFATALRRSLVCRCRLGAALTTLPDSPKDADEDGVEGLFAEVETARSALREAKKSDPKDPALLAAERRLGASALDFARATARAGLKGKGRGGPKRVAAPSPQTAEQIASEFSEGAPAAAALKPKTRVRLLAGFGVLAAGVVASVALQLTLSGPARQTAPKVSFAPEGAVSLVGERSGVSMVDLGKDATAEKIAAFKAAAAANGKTVREIAPGQFIFLQHQQAADAGTAEVLADAGPAESADAAEGAR
ncbi:MAG TPA: hypothetical protein VGK67_33565 [Myxococcales bacterium]|jgi:hypothetical protein